MNISLFKSVVLKLIQDQGFRFLAVGGINAVIGYFLSLGLYALLGDKMHIVFIGLINAIIGITISFFGHRYLVFHSKAFWFNEYCKMYIVNAGSMVINISLLWLFVDVFHIVFWLSQGVILCLMTVYMFFAHKYFTFKTSQ